MGILETVGRQFLVLLPEKHEGEIFVGGEFVVKRIPVRQGNLAAGGVGNRRVEKPFQGFIVIRRQ